MSWKTGRWICFVALLLSSGACNRWAYKVPNAAMEPTIKQGDTIWVDHSYYKAHSVERFDIITFKSSKEGDPNAGNDTRMVKRVIGLSGETVEIRNGKIFVSDQELKLPFDSTPPRDNFRRITISEGEFFVLGDNRAESFDSRFWSRPTLKQASIDGKVVEIKHN